jgi:hypothetical protein
MDLDEIKAHLDRLFAGRPNRPTREQAAGLREALVGFKVGIGELREALQRTERELVTARRDMADYERRGRLALEIGDAETGRIAEEYTIKARERVDLLERKVLVQRDELIMAEREYDATMVRFQAASRGIPFEGEPAGDPLAEGAPSANDALLDHRAKEAAVEAQLAHLKKKLEERK